MRFEEWGNRFVIASAVQAAADAHDASSLSEVRETVAALLAEQSLSIVREDRGPMRLWDFARRLQQRLDLPPLPTGELCDKIKNALERVNDPRIAILATSMPGVGYVYDAQNPDARPVRSSR